MSQRLRNVRIFGASVVGTGLLIGAIMNFMQDGGRWWMYLAGAAACVVVAIAPGQKLRDEITKLGN